MNVTFRQLRLFLALAETGSVSAAAKVMHVTQPTASMQLREVAQSVGVPLYDVVARRVRLTDAGRELAQTARAMVGEWEGFVQRIDAMKGLVRGRLTVAVVSTAESFMPHLLGSFCARHPEIDVSLQVLNRDGVVARLRDNLDDLYIMSTPPAGIDLHDRVFLANPLVVVAPKGHALAGRKVVRVADLGGERFVLRERGSGTRIAAEAQFRKLRFTPAVRLELGSNAAVRASVAGGLGLSVLSVHALGPKPEAAGVVVLPVEGFPIPSQWHVVRRRGRQASPVAEAFEAHLFSASA
jgi:DNA-binding transcriptional LysR family regulator